jgi:pilin isopeptide linkage protein
VAYKSILGQELAGGEFTFQLLDNSGQVVSTAQNNAVDMHQFVIDEDGLDAVNPHYNQAPIYFDEISVDTTGTYRYTIREVAGNDEHVIYDNHVEHVLVMVSDNGDGTLSCDVTYPDVDNSTGTALFENSLRVYNNSYDDDDPETMGRLSIRKRVDTVPASYDNQPFVFDVLVLDENDEPISGVYRTTDVVPVPDESMTVTFTDGHAQVSLLPNQSITIYGLPADGAYSVTETSRAG